MPVVVDASVTMAWLFEGEATDYTESVLTLVRDQGALVPSVWPLEVGNTLLVGERRGRLTSAQSLEAQRLLIPLPIHVDEISIQTLWNKVMRLARELSLTMYDASYVELAGRRSMPLATLDARMRNACRDAGVALVADRVVE